MRHLPTFSYCGLTIILEKPSRFDKASLLSANGGYFFNEQLLRPDYNRFQCELRTAEHSEPFLPGTKCILLLGDSAAKIWLKSLFNLNQLRGSLFRINNIPAIASYFPQDCVDVVDYEGSDDDNDEDYGGDKSRHGRTNRKNFGFWLAQDIKKVKWLLKNSEPPTESEPNYHVYPDISEVLEQLTNHKNEHLYFDIETDANLNITCFAFSFDGINIYCLPCLLPNYSWAYSSLHQIFRALAIATRDNTLVAHNGAAFDYFILGFKYRIPIRKVYDTMLAHHRCYPRVEKSLGHCTSLWTWQPFHKDEGNVGYNSLENARQIWQYCGKDVFTMALIHKAIEQHAKRVPGLRESIDAANNAIRPYLTCILQGIKYDDEILHSIIHENDRLMMQYLRMIELLIGKHNMKEVQGTSKKGMPGSNSQCVRYFHDMLGYPVVGYGEEKKDGTRGPSLGKKNLFKLKLKFENPVIDLCIAYREAAKESGSLKFNPWKEDELITS